MSFEKFNILRSPIVATAVENIDTDQIIPARYLKATSRQGFGEAMFRDWRFTPDNKEIADSPFNISSKSAKIIVAGGNFGCGSSREHAAWAIADYGFRAVVSPFFADIFKNNALNNGLLPVQISSSFFSQIIKEQESALKNGKNDLIELEIDLPNESVTLIKKGAEGEERVNSEKFPIASYKKECLLKGLEDIDYLLSTKEAIEEYEKKRDGEEKEGEGREGREEREERGGEEREGDKREGDKEEGLNCRRIALLPGDGIGPEVINEAVKVLEEIEKGYGHKFSFTEAAVGACAIDKYGDPYPPESHKICIESDAVLFGAIGDPKYDNNPSAAVRPEEGLLRMRKSLGLYANIRPVEPFEALLDRSPLKEELLKGADMIIVRELTGGLYFGEPRGRAENGKKAFDTCVYSKEEIERVSRRAFEIARNRKKHVTLVDKANVLATSRLWRECVKELQQREFQDITLDFLFVDNAAMQLICAPSKFDVILTENLFGDILSDEASVITGSIGLLPSASLGERVSLYEPIHGSYPQAKGKNIANPIATILSAAMMLELSFGMKEEAKAIKEACQRCIESGIITPDLLSEQETKSGKKGSSTTEVGEFICESIRKSIQTRR